MLVVALGLGSALSAHAADASRKAKPAAHAHHAKPAAAPVRHASAARVAPAVRKVSLKRAEAPQRASIGHSHGLHAAADPLALRSAVALVVDQDSGEPLFQKNASTSLPIASITKLMTAMVVLDANLPLAEVLDITEAEIDTEKGTRSRLAIGTRLSRGELLNLALMSSENRAAHALGRHYPGGLDAFVRAMNAKAQAVGMHASHFVDPTGLSSRNTASAHDLSRMVRTAYEYPLIRQFSTANGLTVATGRRLENYHSTNRLIDNPSWNIGLQKTGYISEAGSCLVMQATIDGRQFVMVLLDAQGRGTRFADAQRIRNWIEGDSGVRRAATRQIARAA